MGEFTVPWLSAFSPQTFKNTFHQPASTPPGRIDKVYGLRSKVFHISCTKSSSIYGQDVSWSAQSGVTDLEVAIALHFQTNGPSKKDRLFA
jgi:hypothetical protein